MKKCKDCKVTIECPYEGVCMFNPSDCASDALHDLVVPPQSDVPDTVDGPRCAEQVLADIQEGVASLIRDVEKVLDSAETGSDRRAMRLWYRFALQDVQKIVDTAKAKHAAAREERPSGRRNVAVLLDRTEEGASENVETENDTEKR